MKTLLDLPAQGPQLMQGMSPGLFAGDAFFWHTGRNVVFRDGGVFALAGKSEVFEKAGIEALAQAAIQNQSRIYFGTSNEVGYYNGIDLLSISGDQGAVDLQPYGTFLAYSDRISEPKLWKNGVNEPLGIGKVVYKLAKLGPHLLAFGIDEALDSVQWCSADSPQDWNILSATNSAGQLTLRDLNSPVRAVVQLGSDLAVYGRDSMGILSYIGAPFYFGFQARIESIGVVGPDAVCAVGAKNYGLGRQGAWVTDGVQYQYIDVPAMQLWIQENVNWTLADKTVCYHDEQDRTVVWSFPRVNEGNENSISIAYNYSNGAWAVYSFGIDAALERSAFSYPIVAREDRVWFQGAEAEMEPPDSSWVQTKPLDLGSREVFKRVQEIRLGIRGSARLIIGVQETLDEEVEYIFDEDAKTYQVLPEREAVFWTFRILGYGWKLTSMQMRGLATGYVA